MQTAAIALRHRATDVVVQTPLAIVERLERYEPGEWERVPEPADPRGSADRLHEALTALADDESLIDTPVWEALHNAYEAATGFCYADIRDPRTYENAEAWRRWLVRDWHDADEAGRLLEQGYRLTMERGHPDRAS